MLLVVACVACKSNKKVGEAPVEDGINQAISGKLLVTLLKDKKIKDLEKAFVKYGLKHQSIASKSQNQHLFTFDKQKINSEDILKKLNKNKMVYLAEPLKYDIGQPKKIISGKKAKVPVK